MSALYNPEQYMTLELVDEIASQFDWPAPYTLEDELPDGVLMAFPKCHLLFVEGFEGEMLLKFIPQDTGLAQALTIQSVLLALRSEAEHRGEALPKQNLNLINDRSPPASLGKVRNGIHDQCTIVLAHFRQCLLGDFSWVETYKAYQARRARSV